MGTLGLQVANLSSVNQGHKSPVVFGPFYLYEALGYGGMATVVRAVERESGRVVALKRLLPQFASDREYKKQFHREGEIARALQHPNIIEVYACGEIDGISYMSMEWIEGISLRTILDRLPADQMLPLTASLWILGEVLKALDHAVCGLDAMERPFKVIHRDLSPSNIIVTREGDVKLIDFGIAKSLIGKFSTESGLIKGKLDYMSPEMLCGEKVEFLSDIYSLGVVAWELFTNDKLFRGSVTYRIATRDDNWDLLPSSVNPDIPKEIDELVGVALARKPSERWPSAAAMMRVLNLLIHRHSYLVDQKTLASVIQPTISGQTERRAPKTLPDIGSLPTLSASSQIDGKRRKAFLKHVTTSLDPVFDAAERHRLSKKNGS